MQIILAYCDGSVVGGHWARKDAAPTLPHIYAGWIAKYESGVIINYHAWDMGEGPNMSANIAEYGAVRSCLNWLYKNGYQDHKIWIHSDSQLIIKQLTGQYSCLQDHLLIWRDECRRLAKLFNEVKYIWIPRELNIEADILSKSYKYWGRIPTIEEFEMFKMEGSKSLQR